MTAAAFAITGGSHVMRYNLATGEKTDLGVIIARTYDTCAWMFTRQARGRLVQSGK